MQLITLNPLCPAASLLLTLLHTQELVPIPAHCGLPSKKTVVSLKEEAPRGWGKDSPNLDDPECAQVNIITENLQPNTPPCPSHALTKICKSASQFIKHLHKFHLTG